MPSVRTGISEGGGEEKKENDHQAGARDGGERVRLWLLRLQHAAPVEREGLGGRSDRLRYIQLNQL